MIRGGLIVFAILAFILSFERILDFFNLPRAKIATAKVVAKDTPRGGRGSSSIQIYHVSFEFEDRKGVTLPVSKKFYNSVSEGSKGVLVYVYLATPMKNSKGFPVYIYKRFRKFHIDKTLAQIVNPDQKSDAWKGGFGKK